MRRGVDQPTCMLSVFVQKLPKVSITPSSPSEQEQNNKHKKAKTYCSVYQGSCGESEEDKPLWLPSVSIVWPCLPVLRGIGVQAVWSIQRDRGMAERRGGTTDRARGGIRLTPSQRNSSSPGLHWRGRTGSVLHSPQQMPCQYGCLGYVPCGGKCIVKFGFRHTHTHLNVCLCNNWQTSLSFFT